MSEKAPMEGSSEPREGAAETGEKLYDLELDFPNWKLSEMDPENWGGTENLTSQVVPTAVLEGTSLKLDPIHEEELNHSYFDPEYADFPIFNAGGQQVGVYHYVESDPAGCSLEIATAMVSKDDLEKLQAASAKSKNLKTHR